jgi:hypothetical protein
VYVELPELEEPEPEPEPLPEVPEPESVVEQPAPVEPPEPQPAPVTPREIPAEPAATQQPSAPVVSSPPPAPSPAAPTPPAVSTDAPPGALSTEDLPWLNTDTSERTPSESADDIFVYDDRIEPTTELPDWVVAGEFSLQPESSLDEESRETLEEMNATLPGFQEQLDLIMERMVATASSTDTGPGADTSSTGPGSDGTTTILSGGGELWLGESGRHLMADASRPALVADDFGGRVPADIGYVIVFEVDDHGIVIPGSLIFRNSSGYTRADEKVRQTVLTWRFNQSLGSPRVAAIVRLNIERADVR